MNTIAELNDRFRSGDRTLGKFVMTQGVSSLKPEKLAQLIQLVPDKQSTHTFRHDFENFYFDIRLLGEIQ